jgi:chitinase
MPAGIQSQDKDFAVAAYYSPRRDVAPEMLPLDKLTHIIYSFARVREGEMWVHPRAGEIINALVKQKENHPQLKVMLACGGWGADGFSDMAVSEESREKFSISAVNMIKEYNLDGIDMDWEYPGINNGVIKYRPEDTQRFTLLMKSLREHIDELNPDLLLTFAAAGWEKYYEHIETLEVMNYADFINIMTYDQVGGYATHTAHHTALGRIEMDDLEGYPLYDYMDSLNMVTTGLGDDFLPKSTEKIIDYVIDLGVDPEKILLGAAFYGRSWKGVKPVKNGLYQPDVQIDIGWCSYSTIRAEYENKNGFIRYWDSTANAPYLYNDRDSIFMSYDDTLSVKLKTNYARDKGLAGIMFWQLSDDTREENGLLDAIDKTVKSFK